MFFNAFYSSNAILNLKSLLLFRMDTGSQEGQIYIVSNKSYTLTPFLQQYLDASNLDISFQEFFVHLYLNGCIENVLSLLMVIIHHFHLLLISFPCHSPGRYVGGFHLIVTASVCGPIVTDGHSTTSNLLECGYEGGNREAGRDAFEETTGVGGEF